MQERHFRHQVGDREVDRLGVKAFTAIGDQLGRRMREAEVPIVANEAAAVGALMAMLERVCYGVASRRIVEDDDLLLDGEEVLTFATDPLDVDTDEEVRYHIVGEDEANIREGRISVTSPIARAMIGKEEGDIVVVSHQDPVQVVRLELSGKAPVLLHTDKPQHATVYSLRPGSSWSEAASYTPPEQDSFPPLDTA